MMLAAGPGCKSQFCGGKDATTAAEKLVELIKSKFDEE
jgi:phosphotransferase system HPr-like phosphotransfer protein